MNTFSLLAALLAFSASPVPLLAQIATTTATSTAATSTQAAPSDAASNLRNLLIGLGIGAVGLSLLNNLTSSAVTAPVARASLSFGGRILGVVPCWSSLGPSLFVTIKPAGVFAPTYIWTPLTKTGLSGPPRTPGQQVLGRADIPFVCFTYTDPPFPLYGLRMGSLNNVGTSLY